MIILQKRKSKKSRDGVSPFFSGIIDKMGPAVKILLALNNDLYDLAVFFYAASGFLTFFMRSTRKSGTLPRLAKFSMVLFILDGIPMMLLYHSTKWGEWGKAVCDGRTGALLAHIVILGILAGLGTLAWIKSGQSEKECNPAN